MQNLGFFIGVLLAIMVVPFFSKFSEANGKEAPTAKVSIVEKKVQKGEKLEIAEK